MSKTSTQAVNALKIMLYDVIEPFDNVSLWKECALELKNVPTQRPALSTIVGRISATFIMNS